MNKITVASAFYSQAYSLLGEMILVFAKCLAEIVFILLRYVLRYRYVTIQTNLMKAFPETPEAELQRLTNAYYRHVSDLCIEPVLFYIAPGSLRKRLATYSCHEILDNLYNANRNIVMLASHYGNWEYLINLPTITRYLVFSAYSPVKNRMIDRFLFQLRSRFGVILIPKSRFFQQAINFLKRADKPRMAVVIADQRPGPGSRKYYLPFLNLKTAVQIGGERIATHTNADVVLVEARKTARFQYKYTFRLLEKGALQRTPLAITKYYFHRLEKTLRDSPVCWLWSHDRWKGEHEDTNTG